MEMQTLFSVREAMLETLFLRSYILSHSFRDKTIFFSRTPLLRTLKLTDTKSAPPPLPRGGVRNNGSRLYTYISNWISTRRWIARLHLLEALIFIKKLLQKLSFEIKITTVLETHNTYSEITLCSSVQKIYCHILM